MKTIRIAFVGLASTHKNLCWDYKENNIELILITKVSDLQGQQFDGYVFHHTSEYLQQIKRIKEVLPTRIV